MDLVCIGELLIDFTPCGLTDEGAQRFARNPGGAPANVAVAASRLGLTSSFIGKVGTDSFGIFLRDTLKKNNVDVSNLVDDTEIPTTLAIVSVDETGERSFTFYRKPGADIRLTWDEVDKDLIANSHFMHYGTVALSDEPSRSTVLAAARFAKENGGIICYDPNYRPALWANQADALQYMNEGLKYADIIKVSDDEMELMTGETDCEKGSKLLAKYGATLVTVTLGDKGAYYRMGNMCGHVPGYSVKVADTNGAGDTFLGALLCRFKGMTLDAIAALDEASLIGHIAFANRASSLTCTHPGAIPAMPSLEEVENSL